MRKLIQQQEADAARFNQQQQIQDPNLHPSQKNQKKQQGLSQEFIRGLKEQYRQQDEEQSKHKQQLKPQPKQQPQQQQKNQNNPKQQPKPGHKIIEGKWEFQPGIKVSFKQEVKNESSDESSSSLELSQQLKKMRDPNNINSMLQEDIWTAKSKENLIRWKEDDGHRTMIHKNQGVYGYKGFHELEIKWFKPVLEEAISKIKMTEEERNSFIETQETFKIGKKYKTCTIWDTKTILDLCCGPGRMVRYYHHQFRYVFFHDQNEDFLEQARVELGHEGDFGWQNMHKRWIYRQPARTLCCPLNRIYIDPDIKFSFILANYAFQNAKDLDLEPLIVKLTNSLKIGGILLLKEPEPKDKQVQEFDQELQRMLRPKKTYVILFMKHGCELLSGKTHEYTKDYGPEYALTFQKIKNPAND